MKWYAMLGSTLKEWFFNSCSWPCYPFMLVWAACLGFELSHPFTKYPLLHFFAASLGPFFFWCGQALAFRKSVRRDRDGLKKEFEEARERFEKTMRAYGFQRATPEKKTEWPN